MRLLPFLLLPGLLAGSRPGNFEVVGPGGGGAQFHPTISPHDRNTMLVACDMTGAYVTHDGGHSWRMFNLRGTVRFFAFDPRDANTIYAGATGLWRSTDSGVTWALTWPQPSTITGIQMNSDHADETILSSADALGAIRAFAIDPSNSRVLAAGTATAVYRSIDHGNSWTKVAALPAPALKMWIANGTIYTATSRGIAIGDQTNPAPPPASFTDVSMGLTGNGSLVFYAVSNSGAWVSRDAAQSWEEITLPGSGASLRAIATSLHHPEIAYVSYRGLKLQGQTWSGVARTSDSGRTWTLVWKESTAMASNVHDAWIAPALGPGWGENPLALGVADQNPDLCVGTDLGRTMLTNDGGQTWEAVYSRRLPGGEWTTTGLDVTTSYGYHVDPFDARRRFITYTDIGLSRSEDGGKSWTRSVAGVPRGWTNTTYWVEFDPKVRGRMWAAMSGTHDLPRPKMWRRRSPTTFRGGVCTSDDGGKNWRVSNTGMPETAPTHILLDPASPMEARVLYVAAMGKGVFKSTDGGVTWSLKNRGIEGPEPLAWRLTRDSGGTLYVLIARRSERGELNDPGDGAMYRSTDGAETWSRVPLPVGANAPSGLLVDPENPQRLYLATWARASGLHGEGGGVWRSDDSGGTWRNILDRDQHVYDVTLDPRRPNVLYACGFESSAWRSADRGVHWTRIAGFNFKWGHRVIPDAENDSMIYITTFGGSVWHGRWDGLPAAVDIVTPVLDRY